MAEPQLSVRSARARDLAHRLARRERRSIADVVERALQAYEARETGREPAAEFYRRLNRECGVDVDLEALIKEGREPNLGPTCDLSRHQRRVGTLAQDPSEAGARLARSLRQRTCLSTVVIAEVAFGIAKVTPHQRSKRLERGLTEWRKRLADRIFAFTEEAALSYGDVMGGAVRQGKPMTTGDAMIAAVAKVNGGELGHQEHQGFRAEPICG